MMRGQARPHASVHNPCVGYELRTTTPRLPSSHNLCVGYELRTTHHLDLRSWVQNLCVGYELRTTNYELPTDRLTTHYPLSTDRARHCAGARRGRRECVRAGAEPSYALPERRQSRDGGHGGRGQGRAAGAGADACGLHRVRGRQGAVVDRLRGGGHRGARRSIRRRCRRRLRARPSRPTSASGSRPRRAAPSRWCSTT